MKGSNLKIAARDLYAGPGASAARTASKEAGADWYIASAGLGLVHSSTRVAAYDLSISKRAGRSSVLWKLKKAAQPASVAWWHAMNKARGSPYPLKRLIERRNHALFVVALSEPYFQMVSPELCELKPAVLSRVRIVGLRSTSLVPEKLRHLVMPYDDRLNGRNSTHRGTMSNFAQRTAGHFLQVISSRERMLGARSHANCVRSALQRFSRPRSVSRKRINDERVKELITRLQKKGTKNAHLGLGQLRNRYRVACEQGRFYRLWAEAA